MHLPTLHHASVGRHRGIPGNVFHREFAKDREETHMADVQGVDWTGGGFARRGKRLRTGVSDPHRATRIRIDSEGYASIDLQARRNIFFWPLTLHWPVFATIAHPCWPKRGRLGEQNWELRMWRVRRDKRWGDSCCDQWSDWRWRTWGDADMSCSSSPSSANQRPHRLVSLSACSSIYCRYQKLGSCSALMRRSTFRGRRAVSTFPASPDPGLAWWPMTLVRWNIGQAKPSQAIRCSCPSPTLARARYLVPRTRVLVPIWSSKESRREEARWILEVWTASPPTPPPQWWSYSSPWPSEHIPEASNSASPPKGSSSRIPTPSQALLLYYSLRMFCLGIQWAGISLNTLLMLTGKGVCSPQAR